MTNLSSPIKMTDAMERELNARELSALESSVFSGPAEGIYVALIVVALGIGLLLVASVFH